MYPYHRGIEELGCGRCRPCRINRSRLWVGRMILESLEHPANSFVTLTYNDRNLPVDGCISKRAVQLFLKRLRQEIYPRIVRYYAVGEYGERSWRPHYHLILFGLSPTETQVLEKSWPYGFIHVGTAESASMGYVSGYIMKGMTNTKDLRLAGRSPEFSLMSRKPGIGLGAVDRMARVYTTEPGKAALMAHGWVIKKMRAQGMKFPLGSYLVRKLESAIGLSQAAKRVYRTNQLIEMEQAPKKWKNRKERRELRMAEIAVQLGKIRTKERML